MMPTGWLGGHPESGELLSYSDRSLEAPERERLAGHIEECELCQRDLRVLDAEARLVSAAMASVGTQPVSDIRRAQAWKAVSAAARKVERRRAVRTVWLPRAAAASIAVGLAFGAGPALAFVKTVFSPRVVPTIEVRAVVVSEPAELTAADGSSMSWGWSASSVSLSFAKAGSGTLEFRRSSDSSTSVQVVGAGVGRRSGTNTIIVDNDSGTSPVYVVSLPAHVTQVTIKVAARDQIYLAPNFGIRYDVKELSAGRAVPVRIPK